MQRTPEPSLNGASSDAFVAANENGAAPAAGRPALANTPRASLATLDAFRMLALTIDNLMSEAQLHSLVVMSAEPGDGRSLTAELLSLALRDLRPPVRLLDADPFAQTTYQRRHRGRQFRSTRARGSAPPRPSPSAEEIVLTDEGIAARVPAYARVPVAMNIYSSQTSFVDEVRRALDTELGHGATVVIDVPACSVSSISFAIARLADAALYVVRPIGTSTDTHREIVAQADLLGITLLGAVFNEG